MVDDEAVERSAHAVRAEDRVKRLVGRETLLVDDGLVVRRRIVAVGLRELDRVIQLRGVEPFLLRRVMLPVEAVGKGTARSGRMRWTRRTDMRRRWKCAFVMGGILLGIGIRDQTLWSMIPDHIPIPTIRVVAIH